MSQNQGHNEPYMYKIVMFKLFYSVPQGIEHMNALNCIFLDGDRSVCLRLTCNETTFILAADRSKAVVLLLILARLSHWRIW